VVKTQSTITLKQIAPYVSGDLSVSQKKQPAGCVEGLYGKEKA